MHCAMPGCPRRLEGNRVMLHNSKYRFLGSAIAWNVHFEAVFDAQILGIEWQ